MENNQGLRPSPDFQINDEVTFRGHNGIVVGFDSLFTAYPLEVKLDGIDYIYSFTLDGRFVVGCDIELFRLEESDKPEQTEQTTYKAPSLQTFTDILLWSKRLGDGYDHFVFNGKVYYTDTNIDMEALYELYMSQEEGR